MRRRRGEPAAKGLRVVKFCRFAIVVMGLAVAMTGIARPAVASLARVRFGFVGDSAAAPVFIADDAGYFAAEGLAVTLRSFTDGRAVMTAAADGRIDFGVAPITAGLFARAGESRLRLVAGGSREQPGYPRIGYFATARAFDIGLRTPGDFPGHAIAIAGLGSRFHYALGLLAQKDHFALPSVRVVALPSLAAVAAALRHQRVDGALLPARTARPLMAAGDVRLLGWAGDETPWQSGAVFAAGRVMRERDLVARFLAAYRAGARDYHDVLLASIRNGRATMTPATRPLIADISRHTDLIPREVVVGLAYIDRDGMLDLASVTRELRWFAHNRLIEPGIPINEVVETGDGYIK
jgi:NitT/TauT family transport system substrate-binding protein